MPQDPKNTESRTEALTRKLAEIQQPGLHAMNWMGADWFERLGELNAEFFSFAAERYREDVALQRRLLDCKSPAELQQIQSDFVQTAIDRYTEETGRVIELSQKLFGGVTGPNGSER